MHDQPKSVVRRRQWRKVDFDALREDLHRSSLLIDPPSSVAELFACYDETLKALVDKHAPYADVKLHAHLNAPWYDSRCQIEKQKTRRLERVYRRKKSLKNLSKPGAHNLSTYDSYFENNTRNTGPGRYPRT